MFQYLGEMGIAKQISTVMAVYLPLIALGVICHVAVQNAVTSILVALLLSLIYYYKSYEKWCT